MAGLKVLYNSVSPAFIDSLTNCHTVSPEFKLLKVFQPYWINTAVDLTSSQAANSVRVCQEIIGQSLQDSTILFYLEPD
jgi:hypothetical protein